MFLDGCDPGRAVVQRAREHDRDHARPVPPRRASEERVDRGSVAVFPRTSRHANAVRVQQEVAIGWGDVDLPGNEWFAVARVRSGQRAGAIEDGGKHAPTPGRDVQNDQYARREVR